MAKGNVDPARLAGEELDRWYRRSPGEIEAEREAARQLAYDDFVARTRRLERVDEDVRYEDWRVEHDPETGRDPRWQVARAEIPQVVARAPSRPTLPAPSGIRVGSPVDGLGAPSAADERGAFFDSYQPAWSPHLGYAYLPAQPQPLFVVVPKGRDTYELGDGRLVSGSEVEKIYAEQTRRMRGQDEPEPPELVRGSVNRLRDGQVPLARQLTKGFPEVDPTCHPNGGWELDLGYKYYPEWTKQYENQVTRRSEVDYVVRNPGAKPVKFDGCAVWDPRHELLEAKGPGYVGLLNRAGRSTFRRFVVGGLQGQVGRQVDAAGGRPIDWHVAEPLAAAVFRSNEVQRGRPITVLDDPPR